ncbi:MAG: hypothetical protein IKF36_03070 [Bacilli bacterium]|nr:hypothetical protein [Bacilli bacterium]
MDKLFSVSTNLKKLKLPEFNEENFFLKADNDRYSLYLDKVLYKYVDNKDELNRHIETKNLGNNRDFAGIFNNNEVTCVIPERKTLFDEMISIHEITHLINYYNNQKNGDSISKEVIPYFNEYEYLSRIHEFYKDYYERYRLYTAIKAAKKMNNDNKDEYLPYIYAYFLLSTRKDSYDINKLNQINTKKNLDKSLKLKGYTFKI